jgi:hypothetical protein
MFVAYWHKEGLEIFRYRDGKPVQYASGPLNEIKPLRRKFGKKVLIIGREMSLYIRKRYPPAPKEKLIKALELEIREIFPIPNPTFYWRIFESSNTNTTLDIWGWDREQYEQIKKIFPFNYALPEDLAFFSKDPELIVFQYRDLLNIIASSGESFLGGVSYPEGKMDEREIERFLYGLSRYPSRIRRIKVYGSLPFYFEDLKNYEIIKLPQPEYPPFMDFIASRNLREFKIKGDIRHSIKIDFLLRMVIYFILGYGAMLFFTLRNYDQMAIEIKEKIDSLEKKILLNREPLQEAENYSIILKEINEKIKGRPSPLKAMEILAQTLPSNSFINRMIFNENNLEVSVSSKEPLSLIKALGEAEGIKSVRLRGAPVRDTLKDSYNFILFIELSR